MTRPATGARAQSPRIRRPARPRPARTAPDRPLTKSAAAAAAGLRPLGPRAQMNESASTKARAANGRRAAGPAPRATTKARRAAESPARAGRAERCASSAAGSGAAPLNAPATRAIRPTSDRLREALFDILAARHGKLLEGGRVVDLFAGSGALGLEAISRGAAFALFVDNGAEARALLRANVEALALGGVTRIWRADATRAGLARRRGRRSISPFSIRPTTRVSPRRRLPGLSAAAGSAPNRSSSSRRAPRPRSPRRSVSSASTSGSTARRIAIFQAGAQQRSDFDFARIVKPVRLGQRRPNRTASQTYGGRQLRQIGRGG